MSVICEESHLCFGEEADASHGHRTSPTHLCFGRRYRPQLDALEASAVASVVQDAVHELAILGKGLPLAPEEPWDESFRSVDARFGQPPQSARMYPEMAGQWSPRTEAMLRVQRHRYACGGSLVFRGGGKLRRNVNPELLAQRVRRERTG